MRIYAIALMASGMLLFSTRGGPSRVIQPDDPVVIPQLPPSQFPELPARFRQQLENRGCSIPQVSGWPLEPGVTEATQARMNVIAGHFARNDQVDWAALCRKDGQSSILVFWGKPTACAAELAPETDSEALRGEESQDFRGWIFSRRINWSPGGAKDFATEADEGHWLKKPPDYRAQGHAAITDTAYASLSIRTYYCSGGNWYTFEYTGE
jgi:hypothetical protein